MPKPKRGESESDFVKRCIPIVIREKTAKDGSQGSAICHSMFRQAHNNSDFETNEDSNMKQDKCSCNTYMVLHVSVNENYVVRTEQHQGQSHIVVPVIMMVEGVHHGNMGPLLHTADELGNFIGAWNGIPIVVHHPQLGGHSVSANLPEIIDREVVGRIYNAFMDGIKLCAEAWINLERIQRVSPETLNLIQNQQRLDVSIGVFTEDDMTPGSWNGEEYIGIARGHRPDHLALLPNGQGACSWNDGCGIRVNESSTKTTNQGGDKKLAENKDDSNVNVKALTFNNIDEVAKYLPKEGYLLVQVEQGFRQKMEAIQIKLDRMDDDVKVHYLQEVFDNFFVYELRGRMGGQYSGAGLFKRQYSVASDGTIEFVGEPHSVHREVKYVENSADKKEETKVMEDGKKPCCPEKVQKLIANEHTPYQEADREWLESLDSARLDQLFVMADYKEPETKEAEPITNEQAIQVLRDQFKTPEGFIKLLPNEMQEQMTSALRLHQAERTRLVNLIKSHSKFTEDNLKSKTMVELAIIADMVPKDYSGLAGGSLQTDSSDPKNLLLPPGVGAN